MTYTELVTIAVAAAILLDLLILRTRILLMKRYWIFIGAIAIFFFLVNGILTALPVVVYSSHAIIGLRLVTIPIEDVGYMFTLVTASVSIYEWLCRSTKRQ